MKQAKDHSNYKDAQGALRSKAMWHLIDETPGWMSGAIDFVAHNPQWALAKAQFSLVYRLNAEWRVQGGGFVTLAGPERLS